MNGSDTSKVSKKDLIQAATLALAVSAFGGGNNYVIGEGFGEDSAAAECAIFCLNMQDASECTDQRKLAYDAAWVFEAIQFLPEKTFGQDASIDCMTAIADVLRPHRMNLSFAYDGGGPISTEQACAHFEAGRGDDLGVLISPCGPNALGGEGYWHSFVIA